MLTPGQIIDDKYRIVRLIGEGGMGAVYEGENIRIHRRVAIKVLHLGIAKDQDVVARFEREAQAAGRIGSDHIVEVLDLGNLSENERFMVMEFLEGEHLGARIQARSRLEPEQSSAILLQLLEGLGAAHAVGIIHRDLKPENVFLLRGKKGAPDFVKILDFGISKFNALGGDSMSMTRTGTVMGTPYYMSPEQARGLKQIDHRSDLYSVGVILYEAVTGRVPYSAETFNELIFKIALEAPVPVEQIVAGVDPRFAAIVAKGMVREPDGRFQTASEFAQALTDWLATQRAGSSFSTAQIPAFPSGASPSPGNVTPHAWGQTTPQPTGNGAGAWGQATPQPGGVPAAPAPQPNAGAWGQVTPQPGGVPAARPPQASAGAWGQVTPQPVPTAAMTAAEEIGSTSAIRPPGSSRTAWTAGLAIGGLLLGSLLAVAASRLLRKPEVGSTSGSPVTHSAEVLASSAQAAKAEVAVASAPVATASAALAPPAEPSAAIAPSPPASALAEAADPPGARRGNAPGLAAAPRTNGTNSKAKTPGQGAPASGVTAGGRKIRTEL